MSDFVAVMFWFCALGAGAEALALAIMPHPRARAITAGSGVFHLLLNAGIALWAAHLLWGPR